MDEHVELNSTQLSSMSSDNPIYLFNSIPVPINSSRTVLWDSSTSQTLLVLNDSFKAGIQCKELLSDATFSFSWASDRQNAWVVRLKYGRGFTVITSCKTQHCWNSCYKHLSLLTLGSRTVSSVEQQKNAAKSRSRSISVVEAGKASISDVVPVARYIYEHSNANNWKGPCIIRNPIWIKN